MILEHPGGKSKAAVAVSELTLRSQANVLQGAHLQFGLEREVVGLRPNGLSGRFFQRRVLLCRL